MKLQLVLFMCVTTWLQVHAQTSSADSLFNAGELKQAIDAYRSRYTTDSTNNTTTYNLACAFALSRQIDSAFYYLNIAIDSEVSVRPLTDPHFYYLIDDERWTALQDTMIARVEGKHGPYAKPELSRELWTMKLKDQAFYYHIRLVDQKSPVYQALWELKLKINQENQTRIEEIISEHGWPGRSDVGESAAGTTFFIIQHSNLETQKKYLPLLKTAADHGEVSRSNYALMRDRVNLGEGKEQIYGSQIYQKEDGTYYVKDLFEPEHVNKRRREVGLGPIEDYVKIWGIEWDIEQEE